MVPGCRPFEPSSPDAAASPGQLRQDEAARLFTERAAAASGKSELTAASQAGTVDLCRPLDGLPLAIEFATVRTQAGYGS